MFYLKTKVNGKTEDVYIYDDEIYTRCFNCGKEFQVETELIREVLQDGDFASTNVSCCNTERPKLIRVK